MKFRTALIIITVTSLLMMSSCANGEEENSVDESSRNGHTESRASEVSEKEEIKPTSSYVSSPLALGVWGSAAKYSTSERKYFDIPVRLTGVLRGDKAKEEVRSFMNGSNEYTYKEPDKDEEWVIVEYELCLDGFPLDEGGADCSIVSFVKGKDGGYVNSGGKSFDPITVNITDGNYYFEEIHSGKIAFTLPKDCKDYLIVLGEYEEDQAYFISDKRL